MVSLWILLFAKTTIIIINHNQKVFFQCLLSLFYLVFIVFLVPKMFGLNNLGPLIHNDNVVMAIITVTITITLIMLINAFLRVFSGCFRRRLH